MKLVSRIVALLALLAGSLSAQVLTGNDVRLTPAPNTTPIVGTYRILIDPTTFQMRCISPGGGNCTAPSANAVVTNPATSQTIGTTNPFIVTAPMQFTGTDSGNQTISGNKNYTGSNTFSGPVNGIITVTTGTVGADWAAKLNTALASCNGNSIFVSSAVATGTASTTVNISQSNCRILFDAGQWNTSASPVVNIAAGVNGLTISGAGPRATKIVSSTATADYFQFNGTSLSNINYVVVDDLSLETTVTRTAGTAFNMTWVEPTFEAFNIQGIGLFNFAAFNTGTANPAFHDINDLQMANGGTEFIINTGSSSTINLQLGPDFYADAVSSSSTAIGINWLSGDGIWTAGGVNIVHHNKCLVASPTSSVHWGFFDELICDKGTGGDGIHLGGGAGTVFGVFFTNSWTCTTSGSGNGFYIDTNVSDVDFQGRICNNGGHGAVIAASGSDVKIHDSTISGNSLGSSGTFHGIVVSANVSNFHLRNNICKPTAGLNNTQGWGILVNSGSSDDYDIINNDCTGNVTGAISDGGSGTNKFVHSNVGGNSAASLFTAAAYQGIAANQAGSGQFRLPSNGTLSWRNNANNADIGLAKLSNDILDTSGFVGTKFSAGYLSNIFMSSTAPTIAGAGCGGSGASISTNNGTVAFDINVGTAPTAGGCTVTMPQAATRWNCSVNDYTTISTSVFVQKQTSSTTTSVVFQNYSDVAVATAPTASDIYHVQCAAQ